MSTFKQWFCGLSGHTWTSKAGENIKPTEEQLQNGLEGFWEYAKMYCKKCGYVNGAENAIDRSLR